ncbi:MAG: hypothetical protein EAZ70_02210 [Runella slithyformis]|nr:MAG: hypothetical protein EAY79_09145 [Runella slithyformis]TAF29278.1 MAG: hypothetical protein EAZ70_02210 [Runella slithyformis]TAF48295.1 MAG: hypothetical protein EAZ63_05225 [Runella slithyformis]
MKVWIGFDIGSTNVKAIALNAANDLVAEASMPCTTYWPKPQQTQQDPDEIYYLCVYTLRQLRDKNAHVEAVSLLFKFNQKSEKEMSGDKEYHNHTHKNNILRYRKCRHLNWK